jgi:DNA polymerase-3 subunit gamma/tau
MRDDAMEEPIVKALLSSFEGAKLLAVREYANDDTDDMMGLEGAEVGVIEADDDASEFDF